MLVCKRSTGEKIEKEKERKGAERGGGEGEGGRGRKKKREEGAGQSYYKNPQNNRRGSH